MPNTIVQEENHFKVLRLLADRPDVTQRELAKALGISLGKANYCLQALLEKGLIKMSAFANSGNKLAYAYLLTPDGVSAKARLTRDFLYRKTHEYEALKLEIELLQRDASAAKNTDDAIQ